MLKKHFHCVWFLLLCVWIFIFVYSASAEVLPAAGETVIFKNGDRISGQVLIVDTEIMILKNQALGELRIHWSDINEVDSRNRSYRVQDPEFGTGHSVNFRNAILRREDSALVVLADTHRVLVRNASMEFVEPQHPAAGMTQLMTAPSPPAVPDSSVAISLNAPETVVLGSQSQIVLGGSLRVARREPNLCAPPSWYSNLLATANHNKTYKIGAPAIVTDTFDGTVTLTNRLSSASRINGLLMADLSGNSSLGTGLQQSYGFSISGALYSNSCKGTSAVKPKRYLLTVDGDAGPRYIYQRLYAPGSSADLAGLRLGETLVYGPFYTDSTGVQKLRFTITEMIYVTPMLNDARAIEAGGLRKLNVPLGKLLSIGLVEEDDFFNNAPKAKRKNYIKSALTVTYTFPPSPN